MFYVFFFLRKQKNTQQLFYVYIYIYILETMHEDTMQTDRSSTRAADNRKAKRWGFHWQLNEATQGESSCRASKRYALGLSLAARSTQPGHKIACLGHQVGHHGSEICRLGRQGGRLGRQVGRLGCQVGHPGHQVGRFGSPTGSSWWPSWLS